MSSLSRHISLSTALGVVGLVSLAFGGYRFIRSRYTVDIQKTKDHTKLPKRGSQNKDRLGPSALQKIFDAENRFFKGINNGVNITAEQLRKLHQNTGTEGDTLYDILFELRGRKYFENMKNSYKAGISQILLEAGIEMSETVEKPLDMLDESVVAIISEDTTRQGIGEFEFDIIVIGTDKDYPTTKDMCEYLEENLEDLKIKPIQDTGGNKTVFRYMENIFKDTIYIFILITKNFTKDTLNRYLGEIGLMESLRNPDANWRVVPVWIEEGAKDYENCPAELSILIGIDYWRCLEVQSEGNASNVLRKVERLVTEGRKKYKPASRSIK